EHVAARASPGKSGWSKSRKGEPVIRKTDKPRRQTRPAASAATDFRAAGGFVPDRRPKGVVECALIWRCDAGPEDRLDSVFARGLRRIEPGAVDSLEIVRHSAHQRRATESARRSPENCRRQARFFRDLADRAPRDGDR